MTPTIEELFIERGKRLGVTTTQRIIGQTVDMPTLLTCVYVGQSYERIGNVDVLTMSYFDGTTPFRIQLNGFRWVYA